jgi:phosphoribosylanthranilate isomerase
MLVKICGLHGPGASDDVGVLAGTGIDLVGLLHSVPGSHAELDTAELESLAALIQATPALEAVLVTHSNDTAMIAKLLTNTGIRWVQLHAYQLPATIAELRRRTSRDVSIVKTLHVQDHRCVDARLVTAYERTGVNSFLIDATSDDGRIGSTGCSVPPAVALEVAERVRLPFFLAGGITAHNRSLYAPLARHRRFVGVDVCSAAWDDAGRLRAKTVEAIRRAWSHGSSLGQLHGAVH